MSNFFKSFSIFHILLLGLFARILICYFYSDIALVNEWGKIIHNYETSGIFGFYVAIDEYVAQIKFAEVGDRVLPSVFMPPLYYYFIYIIKYLENDLVNTINLIIFIQIFISLISIIIFYKISEILLKKKYAIILTFIFTFFPLNVLSSTQISSITLQIFLILNFFFYLLKYQNEKKLIYLFLFSIFSGLLILIRGEFFLFYFFTIIYFFLYLEMNFKSLFVSIFITLLIVTPYLNRNYNIFETVTLTKSFGYNLLKGNNPGLKVEGDPVFIENQYPREKLKIKTNNNYEINLDNFYKDKAVKFILDNPMKYFNFYFIKVLSFVFFDISSTAPNYFNFFHILPKLVLSFTSLIGAVTLISKRGFFQYFSLFYIANILFFSIFFILPRYSLILLPIQLFLSIYAIRYLERKLFN